ncbi:MAG: methyltransferase domain-containing protein [Bacteroidia bacterium]|nr:methyltransferase domain-containing protein [Bacteroidia bacterium]
MPVLKKQHDPIGHAVLDYLNGIKDESIVVKTDIAEDEQLSPSYFFRTFEEMPVQEQEALKRCSGKILDVGAGAGSHSIWLQNQGFDVDSLDISPLSCDTMLKRGIKNVLLKDVYTLGDQKYDTILLLMNGAGVAQTLSGLETLLLHLKTLLNPGGKILADSSDLLYLFTDENGEMWIDIASDAYYGEMEYQLSYKAIKGKPFLWLFVDPDTFSDYAKLCGFTVKEKIAGAHFDYMVEIILE